MRRKGIGRLALGERWIRSLQICITRFQVLRKHVEHALKGPVFDIICLNHDLCIEIDILVLYYLILKYTYVIPCHRSRAINVLQTASFCHFSHDSALPESISEQ